MKRDPRARPPVVRLPLGRRNLPSPSRARAVGAALLVACAIVVAIAPWAAWMRGPAALALVALAAVLHRAFARAKPADGWLVVDDQGVRRVSGARESVVVDWREPFGAMVLASADRSAFVVALTMPRAVRYVSARVANAEDAASARTVIACATTAADSDLQLGTESSLRAADAERLLSEIARRVPAALERAYLSDAGGEPVVLERTELRVGGRRIDLRAPLEWRASIFHERGPHAASVCQATWVRQAGVEVVLVAPVPADGGWLREAHADVRSAGDGTGVEHAIARDMRLMQAVAGEPPPRELRRAIDRTFMLPLRRALDRAPRVAGTERIRGERSSPAISADADAAIPPRAR
jgi:hypothetical protein